MPFRLRQALPLAVLALMLVFGAVRVVPPGGAQVQAPQRFVAFGADVTARAPSLPQYAANAHARIEQQMASANAMWTGAFAASGDEYELPVLAAAKDGCGAEPGWAGIYCGEGTIIIDVAGHVKRHLATGQGLADTLLGYVVAHEVGHHVQELRGAPARFPHRELHADCLAGVWGKAAGIPLPPMWAYGEDADHGTAEQRVRWLNAGYRAARPADCDTIWSTSASP